MSHVDYLVWQSVSRIGWLGGLVGWLVGSWLSSWMLEYYTGHEVQLGYMCSSLAISSFIVSYNTLVICLVLKL